MLWTKLINRMSYITMSELEVVCKNKNKNKNKVVIINKKSEQCKNIQNYKLKLQF